MPHRPIMPNLDKIGLLCSRNYASIKLLAKPYTPLASQHVTGMAGMDGF